MPVVFSHIFREQVTNYIIFKYSKYQMCISNVKVIGSQVNTQSHVFLSQYNCFYQRPAQGFIHDLNDLGLSVAKFFPQHR